MAELRDQVPDRPDGPSRGQPNRDAAFPQRDRPGQPSDAQVRRFEQGARDYMAGHGADRGRQDHPTSPGSPRPSDLARFENRARQYVDRDRPGQPRRSDFDKVDRAIADHQTRHPQRAAERSEIRTKAKESESFGTMSPDEMRLEARRRRPESWADIPLTDGEHALLQHGRRSADRDDAQRDGDHNQDRKRANGVDRRAEIDDHIGMRAADGRRGGPEIVGMQLPEGFDDGSVHWLRRHHRTDSGSVAEPGGPQPHDRQPLPPRDRAERAEQNLERLQEPDQDRPKGLWARFRDRAADQDFTENLVDVTEKTTDQLHDAFEKPEGHAEVRPAKPEYRTPDDAHHSPGEYMTGVLAVTIVAAEGASRLRDHLRNRSQRNDADHR